MGSVWHATHLGLDIPCAVKFIEGEIAQLAEAQARFEREAKAAARSRSPHVVQILDHGVFEGTPYIAMELLDGEDFGKRLQRIGRMPPNDVLRIVGQVCRALTKAHGVGIVHRDLKPDNIFLVRDDDREIAKVLDFGIAKATGTGIDGSNTKTGAMLGTPYYMSPEQAQGIKAVDHRSDLWSLAVIVFQALTGRLPFESEALGDLLVRIIVAPVPMPSQFVQDLPTGVRPLVGEGVAARSGRALPERPASSATRWRSPSVSRRGSRARAAWGGPWRWATPGTGNYPAASPFGMTPHPSFGNTPNPAYGNPSFGNTPQPRFREHAATGLWRHAGAPGDGADHRRVDVAHVRRPGPGSPEREGGARRHRERGAGRARPRRPGPLVRHEGQRRAGADCGRRERPAAGGLCDPRAGRWPRSRPLPRSPPPRRPRSPSSRPLPRPRPSPRRLRRRTTSQCMRPRQRSRPRRRRRPAKKAKVDLGI